MARATTGTAEKREQAAHVNVFAAVATDPHIEHEVERLSQASDEEGKRPGDRDMSWVSHHKRQQVNYKRGISCYAVSHFLEFGQVVQMGSGTTLNALMAEIIDYQKSQKMPLDLTILTTNLAIAQMGRQEASDDPKIFGSTQVIITGGSLLSPLNSLVGPYAAENVRSSQIKPSVVFFGVAGIGFAPPNGIITYHFELELATQESYATRPTCHRVVLCDHTKLGKTTNWCARTSVRSLLDDADECTILSSYPSEEDGGFEKDVRNVEQQVALFEQLMQSWRDGGAEKPDTPQDKTQLKLLLVNTKGEVVKEVRLWDD